MKPTAVVGRRVLALLIDYIVLGAIDLAIYFPLASSKDTIIQDLSTGKLDSGASTYVNIGDHSLVGSKAALYFLLTFVIGVFLLIVLPGLKGWSIGKAATGIRIVKEDGTTPPGILRVFVRNLMWIVDDFP